MELNSEQIKEEDGHNNNLNWNVHYSVLIYPFPWTNFSGTILNYINELQNNSTDIKKYFDCWIRYYLFQKIIEKNQLSKSISKNYLSEYLKIN